MKLESEIKQVGFPQDNVYAKLSDLSNLSAVKEKFDDPAAQEQLKQHLGEDKMNKVKENLQSLAFDSDSVSMNVEPVGNIAIKIIERQPAKCIKFESTNSPIKFNLWIQMLPVTDSTSKMKLTVDADVPFFLKGMIEKPLKEGINKLADMLSSMPYE